MEINNVLVFGLTCGSRIERHPDNVAASLFGGFVGTYLNELKPEDVARTEIPLSEVLPAPAGGIDTGKSPPEPPLGIGHYRRFNWAPEIKAIAIIPDFVVPTANARDVLPTSYTRADVVRPLTLHTLLGRQLLIVWYRCLTSNVLHCFQLHWEVPHRTPI